MPNVSNSAAFTGLVAWALLLGAQGVATGQVCESTGFEPQEAFCDWETGFVCGSGFEGLCIAPQADVCTGDNTIDQNCCADNPNLLNGWYTTNDSRQCNEPHIETINPASGLHHLRFSRDETGGDPPGCTGFDAACRQTAFTPNTGPLAITRTVISFDIAWSPSNLPPAPPFGSSAQFFTVADDEASGTGIRVLLDPEFAIFIYDNTLGDFQGVAHLTGGGKYDHFEIDMNPCENVVTYTMTDSSGGFSGSATHDFTGLNLTVQRAVITADNAGFAWDFDNYSVVRGEPCEVGVCCDRTPGREATCEEVVSPNDCVDEFLEWSDARHCSEILCTELTGACCDSRPGEGGVCMDDVLIGSCGGEFQQWTPAASCGEISCEEVTGACCDRTPGSGQCLDNMLEGECVGTNEVWTINAPCNEVTCDEIEGACCDALSGNCFVSTIGDCEAGADTTWAVGTMCSEIACNAATGACCDAGTNDPTVATCTTATLADCGCIKCTWTRDTACEEVLCDANFQAIPAVSEWGLAVMALLLLIATKIRGCTRLVSVRHGG